MRRTGLSVLLLLIGLVIYACGNDTVAPTESGGPLSPNGSVAVTPDGSGGEAGTDDLALKKKAKVDVCHIPPGNPDNAHIINVSENAVPAHLAHGDPENFVDNGDGSCSAAPTVAECPCFDAAAVAIVLANTRFVSCTETATNIKLSGSSGREIQNLIATFEEGGTDNSCSSNVPPLGVTSPITEAEFEGCKAVILASGICPA